MAKAETQSAYYSDAVALMESGNITVDGIQLELELISKGVPQSLRHALVYKLLSYPDVQVGIMLSIHSLFIAELL